MSIKKKIVFKNPVAQELRTPKYKSKVIERKKKPLKKASNTPRILKQRKLLTEGHPKTEEKCHER